MGRACRSQQDSANDARAVDHAAIRKTIASFAKTFENRDAKALAAHFTTLGEFQNQEGVRLRGQKALEKGFAAFFSQTPELKADVRPESLRFLSNTSAIEEGVVAVQRGQRKRLSGQITGLFSCAKTVSGVWP